MATFDIESGGQGGGVQAQPQRDGRSGSDGNQVMATQLFQTWRAIIEMAMETQLSQLWRAMDTQLSQLWRTITQTLSVTERRFTQLEERIDNLEKQAKLDKK